MPKIGRPVPGKRVRLPVVFLDPAVPEHACILEAYRDVTKSHKTEWLRLRLFAGVMAMAERRAAAPAGSDESMGGGAHDAVARPETRRGMPPIPPIFSQGN